MLQFGASLTDDTRSINYDPNTFIIQATGHEVLMDVDDNSLPIVGNQIGILCKQPESHQIYH